MDSGYRISTTLVKNCPPEKLEQLTNMRSVDLGWWTRFYGINLGRGVTEQELQRFVEEDIEKLEQEWESDIKGIKRADLLFEYADGFFHGTLDLLDYFLNKTLPPDNEVLPILFLFHHFAELTLKASIEYMVHYHSEQGRQSKKIDINTHNLEQLLKDLKTLFETDEPFLSEETQEFILKIYRINSASQAFRYPFGKERMGGKQQEKVFMVKAPVLPIGIFKAELDIHGSELISFADWLSRGYIYFPEAE